MVHIMNGPRLGHALKELEQWDEAAKLYETLLADIEASAFFGPDSAEFETIRGELISANAMRYPA